MRMSRFFRSLAATAMLLCLTSAPLLAKDREDNKDSDLKSTKGGKVRCTMQFELRSWAAFYKSGKGDGNITCSNGQKAPVFIRTHGGGVQFGKFNIANGQGKFTPVNSIEQLFGKWATVGGEGAAGKARIGQSLSKDDITLDIKGTGTGGGFGFDFGSFRISRLTPELAKELAKEKAKREKEEAEEQAEKQAKEAEKKAKKQSDL